MCLYLISKEWAKQNNNLWKKTHTNKSDINFKLFAKNVFDYAILAAPPPFFHNFRYLNFYNRKDLIAKKKKGFCYHPSSKNSKSVHEETKNLSPGSSLYK